MIAKLGDYNDGPEVLEQPYKYCHAITEWEPLFSRYKPENISLLKRAIESITTYERCYSYADWKVISEDKKEGITIWQRTTAEGLNSVKAQGTVNRTPHEVFKLIGNDGYRT